MIHWPLRKRCTPIGIDLGAHSIKMVQFSEDHSKLIDAVCWDLPRNDSESPQEMNVDVLADALNQARKNRKFCGRDAIVCLGRKELFLQNLRVPKSTGQELERLVHQEAAGRVPYSVADTEIRFLEAADIRHGDGVLREVILCACHRPVLNELIEVVEKAQFNPVAVNIETNALVRSYLRQYRRDEDRLIRSMIVHLGYTSTAVVIVEGDQTLFLKYIDLGGRDFDQAVAKALQMPMAKAAAMRQHNGDRRSDQKDAEVSQSIAAAVRPVMEQLIHELSLCTRYHSVTFRGKPLSRSVLGGGEADAVLQEFLSRRLDLKCDLFEPLRDFQHQTRSTHNGQWNVAAGLALQGAVSK